MPRFVLLYSGPGEPPEGDLARIRGTPGLKVLDQELSRLLLVDGPDEVARGLARELVHWKISDERRWRVPRQSGST